MMMRLAGTIAATGAACGLLLAPQMSSGAAVPHESRSASRPAGVGAPLVDGRVQSECGGPRAQIAVSLRVYPQRTVLETEVIRARPGSRWVLVAAFRRGTDAIPRQVRVTATPHGQVVHAFSFHTHGDGMLVTARRVSDDLRCYVSLHNR
jgi:hypothetical protein